MNNNYFRYLNQKCPVCNEEFTDNDDIVVCPLCGTPHHRECYKKNGECGNFEKHNEGYRWTPEEKEIPQQEVVNENVSMPQNPVYNSQQAPTTAFFANQPNPLGMFPQEIADGISTKEVAEFIQLNGLKYVQNFFYVKSNKKTFNWGAFFFTPYWFFYRKLYKLGAIFLAITLLLTVGFNLLPPVQQLMTDMTEWTEKYSDVDELTEDEIMSAYSEQRDFITKNPTGVALMLTQGALALGLQIFIGFKANKWYYDHTVKTIKKIKTETADSNEQRLLSFKAGGASMGMAFLAVLANNMIVMIIEMLLAFI